MIFQSGLKIVFYKTRAIFNWWLVLLNFLKLKYANDVNKKNYIIIQASARRKDKSKAHTEIQQCFQQKVQNT